MAEVPAQSLPRARADWGTPAYAGLRLFGSVANAVLPWPEMFGELARAEVREPGHLPYLIAGEARCCPGS